MGKHRAKLSRKARRQAGSQAGVTLAGLSRIPCKVLLRRLAVERLGDAIAALWRTDDPAWWAARV